MCVLELLDCVLPGHVIAQASNEHKWNRISAQDRVKHNLMYETQIVGNIVLDNNMIMMIRSTGST